jgi:hypothetical protein
MANELPETDIREGLSEIADTVRRVADGGEPHTLYNSDEDFDGEPAPRAVLISQERYEELLDFEFRYESAAK